MRFELDRISCMAKSLLQVVHGGVLDEPWVLGYLYGARGCGALASVSVAHPPNSTNPVSSGGGRSQAPFPGWSQGRWPRLVGTAIAAAWCHGLPGLR